MGKVMREAVRGVLERALHDSAFPGAYAIVGRRTGTLASVGVGRIDWSDAPPPDEHTIWDLASLTKVIGMTTAMMRLTEEGLVDLDTPAQRYLPEFTGAGKESVTVRHILTHSAGLPAWRALYQEAATPEAAMALVYATALDTVPGARMLYSDIGAILAGEIVRRVSGETLDGYLERHVFAPLGMTSTMYRPDNSLRARIAPTEVDPWRRRHLRGEVHDENAFGLGGVSGHAGLFSSAHDVALFARMLLVGGRLANCDTAVRILQARTIERFTAAQNARLSSRALGWDTPTGQNSAGHGMSGRAFGHTGFTGTSLWIDPERDVFVLLLTNRVNPSRSNNRISSVRIALADAVMSALGVLPSRPEATTP